MFHVPCGLLHPANNIFFIQTFSMRALVLLVFSLLKTAESGCSQGSIDRALWLLNSSTLFCFCFEHLTLPNSHLQYTTVTIVAQTNKQTNKQTNATRQNYSNANLLSLLAILTWGE